MQGKALVIGGSMSGLLAGLALSRRGWDVDVFERVETELAGRGAGIVAQPQLREVFRDVGIAAQPFIQPIYDVAATRMAFGRVAILGDAAFVARPHVAVGVAKAAEDAGTLARAIDECGDVERGVARFEQLRIGVGRRVIERARHLGAYLQSRARSPEERLRAEKHRAPAAVMAETAVLDFLDE